MDNVQDRIEKLYERTGYMQKYGGSVFFTLVVLGSYAVAMSYLKVMAHLRQIRGNWVKDRCNPQYIPFAGVIQGKEGEEALEFTGENFTGCTQTILRDIAGETMNRKMIQIDEEWTKRPLQLTLTGQGGGGGDAATADNAEIAARLRSIEIKVAQIVTEELRAVGLDFQVDAGFVDDPEGDLDSGEDDAG